MARWVDLRRRGASDDASFAASLIADKARRAPRILPARGALRCALLSSEEPIPLDIARSPHDDTPKAAGAADYFRPATLVRLRFACWLSLRFHFSHIDVDCAAAAISRRRPSGLAFMAPIILLDMIQESASAQYMSGDLFLPRFSQGSGATLCRRHAGA